MLIKSDVTNYSTANAAESSNTSGKRNIHCTRYVSSVLILLIHLIYLRDTPMSRGGETKKWKLYHTINTSFPCVQTARPQLELALRRIYCMIEFSLFLSLAGFEGEVRRLLLALKVISSGIDFLKFSSYKHSPQNGIVLCSPTTFRPNPHFLQYQIFNSWQAKVRKQKNLISVSAIQSCEDTLW